MGKLLHKFVHGVMPSWLFTGFRRTDTACKKLLHFRPRHSISIKSSAPTLPLSKPLDTEQVYLLMDQSTYYYSQSEGEQEWPITSNSSRTASPSIESKSHGGDDDNDNANDDHLHASHHPRMGICALAATSIIKGRWHEDKHKPPPFANKEMEYPTSPASIDLQSQHDNDDHQDSHQQQGCQDNPHPIEHQTRNLTRSSREAGAMKGSHNDDGHCGHGCHHQYQHQAQHDENHRQHHVADGGAHVNQSLQHHADNGPHTNKRLQYHPDDGSVFQHDDDVYHRNDVYHHNDHVYDYHHHGQIYGSNNQLHTSQHGRTNLNMGSHPVLSVAMIAKMGTLNKYSHHHPPHRQHRNQFQNNDQYYQHSASNSNYHQPHLGGLKRKSICLDEDDGKDDGNDENSHHCSIRAWPCLKRQKTKKEGKVAYELPEYICEIVGNSSAVVEYSYQNPQFTFWESMVEMIVGNELWGGEELEFLLHCYLALNDPHLHHTICNSFLQVLKDLQQSLSLQRFTSTAQVDEVSTI